jgi:predicted acyltransferase (DUF342 family)
MGKEPLKVNWGLFGYVLLLIFFLGLFALSFAFGIREWLKPKDSNPLPVDVEYVRVENYFGTSFRQKMQEWLESAKPIQTEKPLGPPVEAVLQKSNNERILLMNSGAFGGGKIYEELICCEGDLTLDDKSEFQREVYCRGKLKTGANVQLQAVAGDSDVTLGPGNEVSRWVDAVGKITLGKGCIIHARVCSQDSIEMESQVHVQSLYAPLIFTSGYRPTANYPTMDEDVEEVPGGEQAGKSVNAMPANVTRLAADTLLVKGDMELKPGSRVTSNLIVQGTLRSGADCVFIGDLKASRVHLGARSQAYRNIVSGGDIKVEEGCFVGKTIVAETDVDLAAGTRVGHPGKLSVVSAGNEIRIAGDVGVWGKLAAGKAVSTV